MKEVGVYRYLVEYYIVLYKIRVRLESKKYRINIEWVKGCGKETGLF